MNKDKLDWEGINLYFPEWKRGSNGIGEHFWKEFLPQAKFGEEKIKVLFKDYGLEIHLNQKVPSWINEKEKSGVEKTYANLSKEVYNGIISNLNDSYLIFESWRNFVRKLDEKKGWTGNLQDHIYFENSEINVLHYDYYINYPDQRIKLNSPTSIIGVIEDLPKNSLNDKWKEYYDLSKNISLGEEGLCNSIIGKTLTECIQNADKIYKLAPELKELKL